MASFRKRLSNSCSITRACSGPTRVGNTPLNRGGRDPNWILYPLSTVCRTHWDSFGRSFHAARKCTKGTSLSRLASGVLWTTSSVLWSGGPAGNGQSSCSKHFFRGSEPLKTATFPGGSWGRNSRAPPLRPLCALDTHFCRACTGASSATDFYPTVKAALHHESADSAEEREGLVCQLG